MKNRFVEQTGHKSAYEGLRISYSSDPCERELKLVTQMLSGPEREMAEMIEKT